MNDREARSTALGLLALKTQAVRFDELVMSAYLDDPDIAAFSTADFLAACESLKSSDWFPKLGELVKACRAVVNGRWVAQEQERAERRKLAAQNFREIPYDCPTCRDNGWLEIEWCDGSGGAADTSKRPLSYAASRWCGVSKDHRPHSFTPGRCECHLRRKAAWDAQRPPDQPQPRTKERRAWA